MTENVLCVLIRRPSIPECPLESKEAGDLKFYSVDLLQGFREKVKDASTLFGVSDLEPTNGRWPIHLSLWGSAF